MNHHGSGLSVNRIEQKAQYPLYDVISAEMTSYIGYCAFCSIRFTDKPYFVNYTIYSPNIALELEKKEIETKIIHTTIHRNGRPHN